MSTWKPIDHTDPSTLPTEADADEGRLVWVIDVNGYKTTMRQESVGCKLMSPAWVAWHPKPKQSPPPYTPPYTPTEPKRRKHCGRVAFISDSGSQLVAEGTWAEVLPGDIDPDAAIRMRDRLRKMLERPRGFAPIAQQELSNALREASK